MTFKNHVENILKDEITKEIRQQQYILETEFCNRICKRHRLSHDTVLATLRRIYPETALMKRHLTDDLKRFFGMELRGHPIVYMPDK